jgi:hypothetical protein
MVPSFEFACCWELGNDHNKVSSAENDIHSLFYQDCRKIEDRIVPWWRLSRSKRSWKANHNTLASTVHSELLMGTIHFGYHHHTTVLLGTRTE